jgi:hypothetical protein
VLDAVSKYAVYKAGVAFTCRRQVRAAARSYALAGCCLALVVALLGTAQHSGAALFHHAAKACHPATASEDVPCAQNRSMRCPLHIVHRPLYWCVLFLPPAHCSPDPCQQPDTSFALPQGEPRPDLHVLAGATRLANIRAIHGAGVAKELLPLEVARGEDLGPQVLLDAPLAFRLTVSGPAAGAGPAAGPAD